LRSDDNRSQKRSGEENSFAQTGGGVMIDLEEMLGAGSPMKIFLNWDSVNDRKATAAGYQ
jgi:hypothetical protein